MEVAFSEDWNPNVDKSGLPLQGLVQEYARILTFSTVYAGQKVSGLSQRCSRAQIEEHFASSTVSTVQA